ncbi:hypothetical protein VNO78_12286 [Psophocarpus tetragonolobus]|uniref:Uncharacterized protein n=1 Tax=Psophocarpus tetragonolobus TaxID=3891 RepID=A0AAN9SN36_PSOTE
MWSVPKAYQTNTELVSKLRDWFQNSESALMPVSGDFVVLVMDRLQSNRFRQFGKGYNGKFWAMMDFNFVVMMVK